MPGKNGGTNTGRIANIMLSFGLVLVAIPAVFWLNAHYYQWDQAKRWEQLMETSSGITGSSLWPSNTQDTKVNKHSNNDTLSASSLSDLADKTAANPGDSIAYLVIPRLNLRLGIIEGATSANLAKGPAHVSKTAQIGDNGTVLISGHRTMYAAPFHDLHKLAIGNEIVLYTRKAVFTYKVTAIKSVKPDDWSDITPDGEPRLVLSTCDPMFSSTKRLLVITRLAAASDLASSR